MDNVNSLEQKKLLHNYHRAFYKLFHLPLDWMPPDNRTFTICGREHCNALCNKINEQPEGASRCKKTSGEMLEECLRTRQPVIRKCHAGFYDAVVPIFVDEKYVGSLCIGQFLLEQPDSTELEELGKQLDFLQLPAEELEPFYRQTRVLTSEEVEGLVEMTQMIGEYICETYGRMRFLESIRASDPILAAERYIKMHYARELTVEGIARSVRLSKSYFIHKFTEQTGSSPLVYLNSYRIEKAAELLRSTGLSISEIAAGCGFQSLPHFYRQFQRYTGTVPGKLRQEAKK